MKLNFLKLHDFKKNKILYNYWKTITAIFLIPFIIINILVFSYYRRILVNQSVQNQINILYQKQAIIDNTGYEADVTYSNLIENSLITEFLSTNNPAYNFEDMINFVDSAVSPLTFLSSTMKSIYIYNSSRDYIYSSKYSGPINNLKDNEWFSIYKQKAQSFIISRIINKRLYITYCFEYYSGNAEPGLIVLNFDVSEIFESKTSGSSIITLFDNAGNSFKLQNKNVVMIKDLSRFEDSSGGKTSFNGVECYLRSNVVPFTLTAQKTGLFSRAEYLTIFTILFTTILTTLILAFILAYLLSTKLYKYMANILLSSTGQSSVDDKYELERVIESIAENSLISSQVENELAEKVALLRQSQTIALQTQITPHFLYNTLQAINVITIKLCGGNNDASKMIVLFSDLLHSALDTKSYLVPLEKEIDYVKQYLEIQKYKYGDKFNFVLDVPEDTKSLTVVKLMLQPIIENAIHHGILPTRKNCRIILSAKTTADKKFIIKISNDGVSIPPEKVLYINNILQNQKELTQSSHIGLPNVNRRIKLIFGEEYGCSIHSTQELTTVTIALPM